MFCLLWLIVYTILLTYTICSVTTRIFRSNFVLQLRSTYKENEYKNENVKATEMIRKENVENMD